MEKVDVSFIIPIFNIENYLTVCIESILKQEGINLEIILINDGSIDNSVKIALSYANRYENIFLIDKNNEGVSISRNIGIENSKGKYICFIDGDDFYYEQFAKKFFDICEENNLDIIRGQYIQYDDENSKFCSSLSNIIPNINMVLDGKLFFELSIKNKCIEVVPWLGYFKKAYLDENKIRFPEGISFEEDQLFFLKNLLLSDTCKVMQVDIPFYAYRNRLTSVTNNYTLKQLEDIVYILDREKWLINNYYNIRNKRNLGYKYMSASFSQFIPIYSTIIGVQKKSILKRVSFKSRLYLLRYHFNKKILVKSFLFLIAPNLFGIFYKRINSWRKIN